MNTPRCPMHICVNLDVKFTVLRDRPNDNHHHQQHHTILMETPLRFLVFVCSKHPGLFSSYFGVGNKSVDHAPTPALILSSYYIHYFPASASQGAKGSMQSGVPKWLPSWRMQGRIYNSRFSNLSPKTTDISRDKSGPYYIMCGPVNQI